MTIPTIGINRRELDVLFVGLGGRIEVVRRTGELRYFHPVVGKPSRPANRRRKSASGHLVAYVRRVIRLTATTHHI